MRFSLLAVPAMAACAAPVCAQEEQPAPKAPPPEREIVVIAGRYFGGVETPVPPIITLNEEEIAAYGANSLGDLLDALSPQTTSARGRGGGIPLVLVNGQRVSSFRELRYYPPEAVKRVEVLPEEVARKYGFPPDQRVVNFILKDNFQSREVEAEYGQPTSGGNHSTDAELTFLRINGPNRFNVDLDYKTESLLTQADRGVIQRDAPAVASDPDPARYRSLVDDSSTVSLNGTWSRGLGDSGGLLSLTGGFERADNLSLRGLDTVMLVAPGGASALRTLNPRNPLTRDSRKTTFSFGTTYDQPLGHGWRLTATIDANSVRNRILTDRRADTRALSDLAASGALPIDGMLPADLVIDGGRDRANSTIDTANSLVTLAGAPLKMPAGDVSATFKLGYDWNAIRSSDTRSGGATAHLKRGDASGGVDLSIPITSRREHVLGGIGDITLSLGGGAHHLSDFGTLKNWNAGLTWKPWSKLTLGATYIWNQAAPTLANLGDARVVLPNEPIFDFTRGETVLAAITTGGNPLLKAETQRDWKFSASWELPFLKGGTFLAEYFRNNSSDVTAQFPLLTPAIEAAFPGRVTRDASGRLLALDESPVTFANQSWKRLHYGIEFNGKLGKPPPTPPEGHKSRGPSDPRSMLRSGMGGQGRWMLSAYHTIEFENRVRVAPGGPELNLLGGDALADGAVPRHKVEVQVGFFTGGLGGRLTGNYQSATHVRGGGLPGTSDLRFGALTTLDLGFFVDMGQPGLLTNNPGILKNMRIFFRLQNMFDTRQKVRDGNGNTPLRYQPGLVDPLGRVFKIQLRKIF